MAPQTHTRFRVQRLIRMGEWLERNQAALQLAIEVIDEAHDLLIDGPSDELALSDTIEMAASKMLNPVEMLKQIQQDLSFGVPTAGVRRGVDVTLCHPYASEEKRYEVVIAAPKPPLQQDAIPLYQAAAKLAQEKKDA